MRTSLRVNGNMEEPHMKNMTDNFMISFLQRFDEHPFDVKIHGKPITLAAEIRLLWLI